MSGPKKTWKPRGDGDSNARSTGECVRGDTGTACHVKMMIRSGTARRARRVSQGRAAALFSALGRKEGCGALRTGAETEIEIGFSWYYCAPDSPVRLKPSKPFAAAPDLTFRMQARASLQPAAQP